MLIRVPKGWELPESEVTPEDDYYSRRRFLGASRRLLASSLLGGALVGGGILRASEEEQSKRDARKTSTPGDGGPYPPKRNEKYVLDRPLTPEKFAISYNNFYEFSFNKQLVRLYAEKLVTEPWSVEVGGLVAKPQRFEVTDLIKKLGIEERLYRFRCVEAWAMAVPWVGFPLSKLLDLVEPLGSAKYVRFVSFNKPEWGPGFADTAYPWPYFEGLTMAEATNELTLMTTGLYGKPLPKQNGAPLRLIVPWKYGFKSAKSIVKIELTEKRPSTFWNQVLPQEYGFDANVEPDVPHPRWSQASERMIDTGQRRKSQLYNGYGEYVAKLYKRGASK